MKNICLPSSESSVLIYKKPSFEYWGQKVPFLEIRETLLSEKN